MKLLGGEPDLAKELFSVLTFAYYVVLGFSIIPLLLCFYGLATSVIYLNYGKTATGKVVFVNSETREEIEKVGVDEKEGSFRHYDTKYTQMIEFKASSGSTVRFKLNESSRYEPGEKIPVIYLEDQPERAKIKTFHSLWGSHLYLLCFGLVLYGVVWFLKYLRYVFHLKQTAFPDEFGNSLFDVERNDGAGC